MLSEVVYSHHLSSPTASLPVSVSGPVVSSNCDINHLHLNHFNQLNHIGLNNHHHHHHFVAATSCSAAAAAAVLMASSSSNNAVNSVTPITLTPSSTADEQLQSPPPNSQHSSHNPVLGATGPSMSLPSSTATSSAGAVLMSLAKPKRSKLRPRLSLRIALSASQQVPGSSPLSPSNGFLANPAGCSFDGCLPLSPSIQQHLHQKSEPLLSASAIDELQPVEILPKLFVGTMKSASDRTLLERLNIGYIINVTTNLPNFFEERYPSHFKYLRIPLEDHWSGEISQYVDEAISFINNARRSDRACLVHCLAGRSRSVAIVLAYIMYTFACTLDDAYDLVKSRKPGVAPGLHFLRQLHDFEKRFVNSDKTATEASNSPCGSSSGGAGSSEESSGCSTPSTSMSLSSFDQADVSATIAPVTGTATLAAITSSSTGFHAHGRSRDRTICPQFTHPSVDSAFTDDQTPPAPTASHSFNMFSADDTIMKD